jgi:hypothetical protein
MRCSPLVGDARFDAAAGGLFPVRQGQADADADQ